MRALTLALSVLLAACSTPDAPAADPEPAAPEAEPSRATVPSQTPARPAQGAGSDTDPLAELMAPDPPAERCHPSCCSAEMRRQQREAAAESGDPSIAGECCPCEAEPGPSAEPE